jgi:hypothetical protein
MLSKKEEEARRLRNKWLEIEKDRQPKFNPFGGVLSGVTHSKHCVFERCEEARKMVACSHCLTGTVLVTGEKIYPHREDLYHKKFWLCEKCGAYVGCHGDSEVPLGTPANANLRYWRRKAHENFDPIWRSKKMTRTGAYSWLASRLGISADRCHIGMFTEEQCQEVIRHVKSKEFHAKR